MKRAKSQEIKVFASGGGMQIVRRVELATAERLEMQGAWRREYCPHSGMLLGFRIVGLEHRRVDSDLRSMPSSQSITRPEMELNVMRSHTCGLGEERRMERLANGALPEDQVERVQAKVRVYPHLTAARGDILRVWPR